MLLRFTCPNCQLKVAADAQLIGEQMVCPACRAVVPLRQPEGSATTTDPILSDSPESSAGTDIDPGEVGPSQVASEDEANAVLSRLQSEMPPVASAYQPSGALPAVALVSMILGIPRGVALALLSFALFAAIPALWLVGLAALSPWLANNCFPVYLLALVVLGLMGFVVAAGFLAAGFAASRTIVSRGEKANNRNVVAATLLALVTAALTVFLIWEGFRRWGAERLDVVLGVRLGQGAMQYKLAFGLGALIALATAASTASSKVKRTKFCERCEHYMKEDMLDNLHLGDVRLLAHALREHDIEAALAAGTGARDGKDGSATLFHCPECDSGYVEATVQFKVTWKRKKVQGEKAVSWLVGSTELSPEEVRRLQPFFSAPATA